MRVYTLLTVYTHDIAEPDNQLIKVQLITTDAKLALANFDAMVARDIAAGFTPYGTASGNQRTLRDGSRQLTIALYLTTESVALTIGRSQW